MNDATNNHVAAAQGNAEMGTMVGVMNACEKFGSYNGARAQFVYVRLWYVRT